MKKKFENLKNNTIRITVGSVKRVFFPRKCALADLKHLYHSYEIFGIHNTQRSEIYVKNQRAKAPIITAYIAYAIAKCRLKIEDNISFVEFFCADGYYTMLARHLGASIAYGYDNGKAEYFKDAYKILSRLDIDNVYFHNKDILDINSENVIDIVANIGGLYHVEDPLRALQISYKYCRKYLIVQSVVSLENCESDYFESPAPGWDWGCRFSYAWLENKIKNNGYEIIDEHFNELEGNIKLTDRGSAYFLIKKV